MSTINAPNVATIALRGPRLLFATLMLGMLGQGVATCAFVSALPQMASSFGARGEFIAQMTMSMVALGYMVGSLASGWILERAGSRVTLLGAILVFGLAGSGGLYLRTSTPLLFCCFAIGFSTSCMVTTCMWGIANEYQGARRAKVLGVSTALSNCSALTGIILGGYLAHRGGWPLSFIQFPVFCVPALGLAFVSIKQIRPRPETSAVPPQPFFIRLLPLYLLATLLFAVLFMGSTQFVFLLAEDGVDDPATRSLIMATVTVVAAFASLAYGALQLRVSAFGTFIFSLFGMAMGLAIAAWTFQPGFSVVAAGLIGVYAGLMVPYLYHTITELTDAYTRSRAIGLLSAFAFFGGFLNPIIFVPATRALGLRHVYLLVGTVMAVIGLVATTRLLSRGTAWKKPISH
jgi:MFS family permease